MSKKYVIDSLTKRFFGIKISFELNFKKIWIFGDFVESRHDEFFPISVFRRLSGVPLLNGPDVAYNT